MKNRFKEVIDQLVDRSSLEDVSDEEEETLDQFAQSADRRKESQDDKHKK